MSEVKRFFSENSGRECVYASDFDRVTAERDALQERLTAADERIDELTTPQVEQVACNHEWTDDGEHLLVCTACGAREDHNPGWRDIATAPRDGTMLRLLVEFEDHSTEDADQAPTIGANNFDNDGEDRWQLAGWCWSHDHFTEGKGVPVGWLPMLEPKTTAYAEQPALVAVVLPERKKAPSNRATIWSARIEGFNDAIDEVARLNGIKP